jgi:hypothetical protein
VTYAGRRKLVLRITHGHGVGRIGDHPVRARRADQIVVIAALWVPR